MKLVIGNKNYSSWSLRPWLVLKQAEIPFEEVLIPLYQGDYKEQILKYSSSGKVPLLIDGDVTVWESLAICEYLADRFPEKNLWPAERSDRSWARSIANEMHAGFGALRSNMPMNVRASHPGKGRKPEVDHDILRIRTIWKECREFHIDQGPFLFGSFSIADAMFAPVVFRFKTYGVELGATEIAYSNHILNLPAIKEWIAAGSKESYVIAASEIYSANK